MKFPTAVACGHSVAAVAREIAGVGLRLRSGRSRCISQGCWWKRRRLPRLVERIGKETSLPEYSCVFVLLSDQLSVAKSQKLMHVLTDKFGRAITDLRISITDRCNYKCVYCRTGNEGALYGDLSFADYLRMGRVLVGMGITKIRLTGGEPLLRNGVVEFVRELAKLRPQGLKPPFSQGRDGTAEAVPLQDKAVPFQETGKAVTTHDAGKAVPFQDTGKAMPFHDTGKGMPFHDTAHPVPIHDTANSLRSGVVTAAIRKVGAMPLQGSDALEIALTTNGHLLADLAQPLKDAGLSRVTVSMDAVDPDRFKRITRVPNGFDNVLAGIRAARRAGLGPVKVNCVLMRGFNEDQIIPFGMFAREEDVIVRFIEFMPLEEGRTWAPSTVVTMDEILARIAEYRPLVEIPHGRSETARRYHFEDGIGEIGIIAPVSHPFCGHCSRIRITSDGKIRTCLFSVWDHDLHAQMRRGASDEDLAEFIRGVVMKKEERHHIGEPDFVPASRTMVHIGG